MNIKSLLPQVSSLDGRIKTNSAKDISSQETQDRDSNGRQERGEDHPKRPMTDDELDRVVEIVKTLSGVSQASLIVRLVKGKDHSVVLIEGPTGEVIRRLTEVDLWHFLTNQEKKTGHILDKAM